MVAPVATPAALPALPVDHRSFSWRASKQVLDLTRARELADPYDEAWRRFKEEWAKSGREIDDSIRDCKVFAGSATSMPREVFGTRRRVDGLRWDVTAMKAVLTTSRLVPSPLLNSDVKMQWHGEASIDIATGRVSETLASTPDGLDGAFMGLSGQPDLSLHPTGRVLLDAPGPGAAYRSFTPYLQEPNGETRRLEIPLGASRQPRLLADGNTLSFTGDQREVRLTSGVGMRLLDTFFLPVDGSEALVVATIATTSRYRGDGETPDPVESRTAFLTAIDDGSGYKTYVGLYDSRTRAARLLAEVPVTIHTSLQWRGDEIVLVEIDNAGVQVHPDTGVVRPVQPRVPAPTPQEISPDGRYVVDTIEPDSSQPSPAGLDCTDRPYRVELLDRQAGSTRVLFECTGGGISWAQWVNNEKFVLFVSNARAGKGGPGTYLMQLVDVSTGSLRQLLPEHTTGGGVVAAPGGDRFLLVGDRLWLFGAEGALLRDFGPPPKGYRYEHAAWSPDGSAFAYTLKPAALSFF